ncbi:MAG: hypothetical protein LBS27_10155 [Bifidobacteriaceae bacterium]|nr:hypothetical protein [Bifidobacteriaceae bacterium]
MAAFAVECAAFGHLLGAFGGPQWVAPCFALLWVFIREVFATSTGIGWATPFTRLVNSGPPWLMVSPRGLLSAATEAAVIVLLALTLPGSTARLVARVRGRILRLGWLRTSLVGVSAVATAAGWLVVWNGPPVIVPRPAPDDVPCTDTATRLCVWPESAAYLPQLAAMAERADVTAGAFGAPPPAPMYELGLDDQASTFVMVNSTTWFMSSILAADIAWSVEPPGCELEPADPDAKQADGIRQESGAMIQLVLEDSERPVGMGDYSGLERTAIELVWREGAGPVRAWIDERLAALAAIDARPCQQ